MGEKIKIFSLNLESFFFPIKKMNHFMDLKISWALSTVSIVPDGQVRPGHTKLFTHFPPRLSFTLFK